MVSIKSKLGFFAAFAVLIISTTLILGCTGGGQSCIEAENIRICGSVDITVPAGESATAVITVKNLGDSRALVSIPRTEEWLEYTPTLGTESLEPKQEREITVTAKPPAGTTPGTYERTISFMKVGRGIMGMDVIAQLPAKINVV